MTNPLRSKGASAAFSLLATAISVGAAQAAGSDTTLPTVRVEASAEQSAKETLQAVTTKIGKGKQELRDIPQSVTVVTERLIDDRNLDTLCCTTPPA